MPYGTLTLHTQRRDITVELVDHHTATRMIRAHTGRISAAEAFFRGDEIDSDDFDGQSKLISIGLSRVVSIEWEPYPEGDGDLLPSTPPNDRPLTASEVRWLVRALWRAKDDAAEDPVSPKAAEGTPDVAPAADATTPGDGARSDRPSKAEAEKRAGRTKKSTSRPQGPAPA